MANQYKPSRYISVGRINRQWICESREGFLKGHVMFETVCECFRLIPFKIPIASSCHSSEYYHSRQTLSEGDTVLPVR